VDSLLNSGESNFSSAVTCIKYVFLDIWLYIHHYMPSPYSYFWTY
jgi:hypothetical protein